MANNRRDDDLAYGDPPPGGEGERGFIGDMGKRFFGGGSTTSAEQVGISFAELFKAVM